MPINDIAPRFQETGRIRLGARSQRGRPTSLETFRLTSASRTILEAAAHHYGGEVRPWQESPGQFELFTEATEIPVILPPSHAFDQWLELWSAGGCQRRCDGAIETLSGNPCLCPEDRNQRQQDAEKGQACKPITRLNLMLQELPGIGVWRLETSGWIAAVELQGAVNVLSIFSQQGRPVPAVLRLVPRAVKRPGEPTHNFVVPVLDTALTPGQLLTAPGETPMLAAPTTVPADRSAPMPSGPVDGEAMAMGPASAAEGEIDPERIDEAMKSPHSPPEADGDKGTGDEVEVPTFGTDSASWVALWWWIKEHYNLQPSTIARQMGFQRTDDLRKSHTPQQIADTIVSLRRTE